MNLLYTPIEDSLQKDLLLFRHNNFASCVVPVENKHQYITELSKYRQELISDTQKKDEYIKYLRSTIDENGTLVLNYISEKGLELTLRLTDEIKQEIKQEGFTSVYSFDEYPKIKLDTEILAREIEKNYWRVAKATANPHSYTMRKNWNSNFISFEQFVQYIRENGEKRMFWRKPYIVLEVGDYIYWTMGSAMNITILINRTNK